MGGSFPIVRACTATYPGTAPRYPSESAGCACRRCGKSASALQPPRVRNARRGSIYKYSTRLGPGSRVVIQTDAPESVSKRRDRDADDGSEQSDRRIEVQRTVAFPKKVRCREVVHECERDDERQ